MRNKTNRENTRKRKQSHAQDNIYVVRQFAYVHGVVGISLLSGKNTEYKIAATILFLSPSRMRQQQPTILKTLIMAKSVYIYEMDPKNCKFFIKNHAILFGSGRVVKPDQTKLGSTKPNI